MKTERLLRFDHVPILYSGALFNMASYYLFLHLIKANGLESLDLNVNNNAMVKQ